MSLSFPPCVPNASRPAVVVAQAMAEAELREALRQEPRTRTLRAVSTSLRQPDLAFTVATPRC